MLRDDAVGRIQRKLSFRNDLTTEIIDALKDAQVKLEGGITLPWFLQTEVTSSNTVPGDERLKLPTDFLRATEQDALYYYNGAATEDEDVWNELAKDDIDVLRTLYPGSGVPKAYAIDPLYFRFFPTPDAIYDLKIIYHAKDTVLDSNIENKWLKHAPFLLIGMAGQDIAESIKDNASFGAFQKMEQEASVRLLTFHEERMHANKRYIMGGPD